jgi:hypothetical protein
MVCGCGESKSTGPGPGWEKAAMIELALGRDRSTISRGTDARQVSMTGGPPAIAFSRIKEKSE